MKYGQYLLMKTTLDIQDALLLRAKRLSQRSGRSLRSLVEEGLRRVLAPSPRMTPYKMPDRSVGEPGGRNPLEGMSWQELRDEIYGATRQ